MKIWDWLIRTGKEDIIKKSIIWNTIIDIFKSEKNIDPTSYLSSIQIKWTNIIVKTNKPIINTELYNINDKIKEASLQKLQKIWIKILDFDIKYI